MAVPFSPHGSTSTDKKLFYLGFGFIWPDNVKTLVSLAKIVNFGAASPHPTLVPPFKQCICVNQTDINLCLFDCWLEPGFLAKWLFLELMPFMYLVRYFVPHYICKWRGLFENEAAEDESWYLAFKDVIFLLNMLYISLTSTTLFMFNCTEISDELIVMTLDPRVECYTGDHLIAMILAPIPLVLYVIGWPLCMWAIFYIGRTKTLLDNPRYIGAFGFLYTRCGQCLPRINIV